MTAFPAMRSVRAYLITLVAIPLVLATGAFALVLASAGSASREQAKVQAHETAKVLAQAVDRELDRSIGVLAALRESEAMRTGDWQEVDRQARAAVPGDKSWIVVQDRSGRQLVNTRLAPGADLPAGSVPQQMWDQISGGKPRACDLSTGLIERRIVCIDMPAGGQPPTHAISMVFRPDFFESIVRRERVSEGSIATLVDRNGTIIWRSRRPAQFIGRSATGDMARAIRARPEGGVLETVSLEGVPMLSAYQRSRPSGWSVIVGTPVDQVAALPSSALWRGSLLALAVLAMACFLALFAARRLGNAIAVLGRALVPGERTIPRTGIIEIDDAAATLERAVADRAESEQRFRELADAAPVLIWVADTKNKGVWYNKAWLDFTGRSMDEELGDGWIAGVHPHDRAHCAEVCGGSFDRREPFRLDFRLRRSDGAWRTIEDTGVPRFSDSGEFLGYIGTCVDVTDARAAEAQIRASEARYRRIFEQTSDLIFTADLDQVITGVNPAAARAVGLDQSQVIGRKISDFLSPEDYQRTSAMLRQKLEQGGTTRYDVQVRDQRGEWLSWEINSGLTFDDHGQPVGLHIVARDVTDRKRSERQQEILVGELNHRVKNTLAVVQSLAHQTFRGDRQGGEATKAFEGRLQALASAHNLLTRQGWEHASIAEIAEQTLAPFCTGDRCDIRGPDFKLGPQAAVSLSLAIHELATNAAKYGALSNPAGRVLISWTSDENFQFEWREEGGPPVAPPTREGFGTRMIKRSLAADLNGTVEIRFDPGGLVCRVEAVRATQVTPPDAAAAE